MTPLIDIDLTYDYLEELVEDECKCESKHEEDPCSVLVVGRKMTACERPDGFLICQSSWEWNTAVLAVGGLCDGCRLSIRDCWSLVPA